MVGRQHHLLGFDSELIGDKLDGVDRRTIDVRLARLAQPAVADWIPNPSSRHFNVAGPQSIADVCTTSGTRKLRRGRRIFTG
jgi:hypothetical protein